MEKSNDNIPADEMLLAETLAAAKAGGFRRTTGYVGSRAEGCCCAIGGLLLRKGLEPEYNNFPPGTDRYKVAVEGTGFNPDNVWLGNDNEQWLRPLPPGADETDERDDSDVPGYTFGRAFWAGMGTEQE